MELDPEWLKPREERPKRRGLIGALRKETNLKCLILTCLIYGCVLAIVWCRITRVIKVDIDFSAFPITSSNRQISPCDDGYIYIPSAFVIMLYLLYLIECWHSKAWVQLRFEKTDVNRAYRIVEDMRQAQPLVWWKAVCYHYVRRTRKIARTRNGSSYPATQVYYERVNSNLAAGCFYFGYCGVHDISPELLDLEKHAATKIRLSKGFLFANLAAAQEFEEQRSTFFQDQERCDDYMEMKEGLDLASSSFPGEFKENLISWTSPDNLPWFARSTVFWISNFLLLSWPLRLILELNTAHVHYQVNKLFGSNYVTPMSPLSDLISSGNYSRNNRNHQNQRRRAYHPQNGSCLNHRRPYHHHHHLNHNEVPNSNILPNSLLPTNESEPQIRQPIAIDQSEAPDQETDPSRPLLLQREKSPQENNKDTGEKVGNSDNQDGFQSYFHFRHSNPNPLHLFSSRNRRMDRENHIRNSSSGGCPKNPKRKQIPRSVTLIMTKGERKEFSRFGFNYFDIIREEEERIFQKNPRNFHTNNFNYNPSTDLAPEIQNNVDIGLAAPSYSQALLLIQSESTNININRPIQDNSSTRNLNTSLSTNNGPLDTENIPGNSNLPQQTNHESNILSINSENSVPGVVNSNNSDRRLVEDENLIELNLDNDAPSWNFTLGAVGVEGRINHANDQANGGNLGQSECIGGVQRQADYYRNSLDLESSVREQEQGDQSVRPRPRTTDGNRMGDLMMVNSEQTLLLNWVPQPPPTIEPQIPLERPGNSDLQGNVDNGLGAREMSSNNLGGFSTEERVNSTDEHYRRMRRCDSGNSITSSSLVLNTLAPRGMTRVPIDLTQPIVMTVPNDPRNSSTTPDSPPSYEEALRTSRPVFLPTWARIRRCFTERDLHSRLYSSSFWLNEDEDNVEASLTSPSDDKQTTSQV